MKDDNFEERLRRQPLRPIPSEWRGEILGAARAAASSSRQPASTSWWLEWLWPCPRAWAGLAAAWIVILALQYQTPPPRKAEAKDHANDQPSKTMAIEERRRELFEVLDLLSPTAATAPAKPPAPRPRGQARSETAAA